MIDESTRKVISGSDSSNFALFSNLKFDEFSVPLLDYAGFNSQFATYYLKSAKTVSVWKAKNFSGSSELAGLDYPTWDFESATMGLLSA